MNQAGRDPWRSECVEAAAKLEACLVRLRVMGRVTSVVIQHARQFSWDRLNQAEVSYQTLRDIQAEYRFFKALEDKDHG